MPEPGVDFAASPDSRWTVRGSAGELPALLRRAGEYLEPLGAEAITAVGDMSLDRTAEEVLLTVVFDHGQPPADLDYLDPGMAAGYYGDDQRDDIDLVVAIAAELEARTVVDFGCGTGQLAGDTAAGRRPGRHDRKHPIDLSD